MYRGTTPTFVFTLDVPVGTLQSIYLTFKQLSVEITKQLPDLVIDEATGTLQATLSQDETLLFSSPGGVEIQLRAITASGRAVASTIVTVPVERILLGGVIT